jgi:hypothetical protein
MTAPRYDKYDPISGGFRAKLAADLTFDAEGSSGVKGVSLDTNGRVVVGTAAQSGLVGVMLKNVPLYPSLGSVAGGVNASVPVGGKAGQAVDIMTAGEIVDVPGLTAGNEVYVTPAGVLTHTATANFRIGFTVEATRLIVRLGVTPTAGSV